MNKYLIEYILTNENACKCCLWEHRNNITLEFDSADEAYNYVLNFFTNKTTDRFGTYLKPKILSVTEVLKLEEENRGNMNTYQWTSGEELKLILDEADRLTEGVNIDDVKL